MPESFSGEDSGAGEDPLLKGLLGSLPPRLDPEAARGLMADRYGIDGKVREIACERDQNFHVVTGDGRGYALKLANSGEDPDSTRMQTEALLCLERERPDLPVPKMVPSVEGHYETSVLLPDGRRSVVRVLTWLEGTQVSEIEIDPALERNIGTVLADMGSGLRAFRHPGARRELLWDISHVPRLRPLLGAVPEDEVGRAVRREMDQYEAHVVPRLPGLRRQVIHNDLNHHNVLVDPGNHSRISGIIDFGDLVETSLIVDVAVAASYLADRPDDPLSSVARMVQAYHEVTPLTGEEVVLLRDLIVARLVTSIVITEWRARRYPANATYILRNNGPARDAMARFATLDPAAVTDALLRCCNLEAP